MSMRWLRRAIEAAHMLGFYAADQQSRTRLMSAYSALARRSWNANPFDVRLRIDGTTVSLRMRQRDIYVIGEILHDKVYGAVRGLRPKPVVIDAGANIGVFSIWVSCLYPQAVVHCFEPEARNFELLEHNLRHVDAFSNRVALANRSGAATLYVSQFAADHTLVPTERVNHVVSVPCVRLTDYLDQHGIERVDLLKLDVEGGELEVLKGAEERMGSIARIIGECHEALVDPDLLYAFLARCGHRVVRTTRPPRSAGRKVHIFETLRSLPPKSVV